MRLPLVATLHVLKTQTHQIDPKYLDLSLLYNRQNGENIPKSDNKQDHCRGVYLLLSIKREEIPFARYSQFFIFR